MKPVLLVLGACVLLLLFPGVLGAVQDFRSEEYTEAHGAVTTAAAVTSANITLTQDLFGGRTSEVVSVTSSNTTDVPLVTTYTAASDRLLVTGLGADASRTLTIIYNIGRLDDFIGADTAAKM